MKPIDRRKLMAAINRACHQAGLLLEEDPDAGGGSHGSLLFSEPNGARPIRIIIVYAREISPGVQRAILQSLGLRAQNDEQSPAARALAQRVHDLLQDCFNA